MHACVCALSGARGQGPRAPDASRKTNDFVVFMPHSFITGTVYCLINSVDTRHPSATPCGSSCERSWYPRSRCCLCCRLSVHAPTGVQPYHRSTRASSSEIGCVCVVLAHRSPMARYQGKCNEPWMVPSGNCLRSCGRCKPTAPRPTPVCTMREGSTVITMGCARHAPQAGISTATISTMAVLPASAWHQLPHAAPGARQRPAAKALHTSSSATQAVQVCAHGADSAPFMLYPQGDAGSNTLPPAPCSCATPSPSAAPRPALRSPTHRPPRQPAHPRPRPPHSFRSGMAFMPCRAPRTSLPRSMSETSGDATIDWTTPWISTDPQGWSTGSMTWCEHV